MTGLNSQTGAVLLEISVTGGVSPIRRWSRRRRKIAEGVTKQLS